MNYPSLGIIGAGNMGNAIIQCLLNNRIPANFIHVSDPSPEKLLPLKNLQIYISANNAEIISRSEIILFAIKPQHFHDALMNLPPTIFIGKKFLSIMAGVSFKKLHQVLGKEAQIIRIMPNTPALIGMGASGLLANAYADTDFKKTADMIFSSLGKIAWVKTEDQLNMITALSGSGPAYFFLLMEAMQQAAIDLGLPTDLSRSFTLQTALGAAHLAESSNHSFAELRAQVTSKGGTTEAALNILHKMNFHGIMAEAMQAAEQRARVLGE